MPVVSNTSPILNLAIVNQLVLLRRQFGEILIPNTVLDELKLVKSDQVLKQFVKQFRLDGLKSKQRATNLLFNF
jgi:uncharacterized protein